MNEKREQAIIMDEDRQQAITTVGGVKTCYYNGLGKRRSYYIYDERELSIIMDGGVRKSYYV